MKYIWALAIATLLPSNFVYGWELPWSSTPPTQTLIAIRGLKIDIKGNVSIEKSESSAWNTPVAGNYVFTRASDSHVTAVQVLKTSDALRVNSVVESGNSGTPMVLEASSFKIQGEKVQSVTKCLKVIYACIYVNSQVCTEIDALVKVNPTDKNLHAKAARVALKQYGARSSGMAGADILITADSEAKRFLANDFDTLLKLGKYTSDSLNERSFAQNPAEFEPSDAEAMTEVNNLCLTYFASSPAKNATDSKAHSAK